MYVVVVREQGREKYLPTSFNTRKEAEDFAKVYFKGKTWRVVLESQIGQSQPIERQRPSRGVFPKAFKPHFVGGRNVNRR